LAFWVGIINTRKAFDIVVDAIAGWTRSSFCTDSTCVEVATFGDSIAMRDGKNPNKPYLQFTREQWDLFRIEIVRGTFNFDG